MIICKKIVIPRRKPRFQKEFIWRGQGYDCKWDFISNTKYNFNILPTINFFLKEESWKNLKDQRSDCPKVCSPRIIWNFKLISTGNKWFLTFGPSFVVSYLELKVKKEKLQLQKRRQQRKRPKRRWKKCNPVRKKKRQL